MDIIAQIDSVSALLNTSGALYCCRIWRFFNDDSYRYIFLDIVVF